MDADTIVFWIVPAVNYVILGGLGLYLHLSSHRRKNLRVSETRRDSLSDFNKRTLESYIENFEGTYR